LADKNVAENYFVSSGT